MANTTWNPSDKSASATLTGGNLIVTSANAGTNSVRAIDKQFTGKFYWECTYTTATIATTAAGGMAPGVVFGGSIGAAGSAPIGSFSLARVGNVYVDGVSVLAGWGTITSGTVVCIAFDCGTRAVWFRLGAAGLWNLSASANPATGVGGIATSLGGGVAVCPAASLTALNDQITANFGGSAFTGAVPAGFTSGFTAGATIPNNALATQAALEQWTTPNPAGQVTQVALEEWVSTSVVGVQALVTQVALEQWARVPVVVATGRPRRVQNIVRR
jgi:hypothetical protein